MASNKMIVTIGYDSNGIEVRRSLLPDAHLFVSYISAVQIRSFFQKLLQENSAVITHCLLIGKEVNITDLEVSSFDSYVYDEPTKGTIQKRSKLFTRIHQLFKKREKQNKAVKVPVLLFIDDIWQLVPRLNKRNSTLLKELLQNGAAQYIYLVVGSTLPYRNLLVQLMKPDIKTGPLNDLGAEITINPDNLLFYREKNQLNFSNYYPETKENEKTP